MNSEFFQLDLARTSVPNSKVKFHSPKSQGCSEPTSEKFAKS